MKYVYPAIFTPSPEGYEVVVPDLPGCFTYGESLPDALEMARDAVEMWLWAAENQKDAIPPATNPAEIARLLLPGDQFVNLISADTGCRENGARAAEHPSLFPCD